MRQLLLSLITLTALSAPTDGRYQDNPLPDIPYRGPLMSAKLNASKRSDLILQTKLERILSNKGFALVVLAEDKSKRTANYRRTSVIGYYPFNDESFVTPFANRQGILNLLRMPLRSLGVTTNATILEFLEKHYGKRSRMLFRYNLQKTASSANRREALGNQIYATYPGTRHCQVGKRVNYNPEKAPLHDLEKCCVIRNRCDLQSGVPFKGLATPTSADNFRRVSCDCDAEFHSCLHSLSSPNADYLGELFYNVLELQCLQTMCNGTIVSSKTECPSSQHSVRWKPETSPYKPEYISS
ncbi:uncharacterized protein [Watersipora subatra]|uniref:uncharacterized protein n=1 Tax=Watersipora subatra TaxID=2589382 RepID=UPI00355C01E0